MLPVSEADNKRKQRLVTIIVVGSLFFPHVVFARGSDPING